MNPLDLIEKHWKPLTLVTIVFLIVSVGVLSYNIFTTGSFMKRDVDLSGGKEITVQAVSASLKEIKAAMPYASVRITSGIAKNVIVEVPVEMDEAQVLGDLHSVVDFSGEPSIRTIGPSVANSFFQNAEIALVAAFLLMAATVFLLFRSVVPSTIVIIAAATDIIGTMAVISVMGVPLSLPVLVALLTLIGYSVDTDIVLTNELLKTGHTNFSEGYRTAMKTGLTLTATALVALLSMYVFSGSFVIEQIALVLLIGLVIDMPATWLTNAGILRYWFGKRGKN